MVGGPATADPFGGVAAVVERNRTFHAILISLMLAQLTGLLLLARRLGLDRPIVVAGSTVCAVATTLLLIATVNDGFVTYEVIARCRASAAGCNEGTRTAFTIIIASVQAFTKLGIIAQSLGFAIFASAGLNRAAPGRVASLVGVAIASVPLALLASGAYLGPKLIMHVLVFQALFGAGAAVLLGSGRMQPVPGDSQGAQQ